MKSPKLRSITGLFAMALLIGNGNATLQGADHRDGPRTTAVTASAGNVDINDVYVFQSPTNKNNTVIALTVSPAAGVVGPSIFMAGATYEIRIQNNVNQGSPFFDNLLIQFHFSTPNNVGRQAVQMTIIDPTTGQSRIVGLGMTGSNTSIRGGGQYTAGMFDDPFFFDLNAFNTFLDRALAGAPLANRVAPFLPPSIPNSFFGGFNVLSIVMEVPSTTLGASKRSPNLRIWARTIVNGQQFDRMAVPAINTAIIPTAFKDAFNDGGPLGDPIFRELSAAFQSRVYGTSSAYASTIASVLLPDVINFNVTSSGGFPNGRRLQDDVIDAEFSILTNGALKSDRVGNDSNFRPKFPYLGVPNPLRFPSR